MYRMNNTREFDLAHSPLSGIHLLEAAAGTGKTYAIAFLVLRLIIEEEMKMGEILALTYTVSATEELRGRIRTFIKRAIAAFLGQPESDAAFIVLRDHYPQPERALRLLQDALRDFDDAAIHTIHSFCFRVLTDHAFASGQPANFEILPDDAMLLDDVVRDLWRRYVYDLAPELVATLIGMKAFDMLRALSRMLPRDPITHVTLPSHLPPPPSPLHLRAVFAQTKNMWWQERDAITGELHNLGIKRNIYQDIPSLIQALDSYFAQEMALPPAPELEKVTYPKLKQSLRKDAPPPTHPFFPLAHDLSCTIKAFTGEASQYAQGLAGELYRILRDELPTRKRLERTYAFDDLLAELYRAIRDESVGPVLHEAVRRRYRAALIDEFQDTDPVQYEILRYFFGDGVSPLFLIGDPRQAIYSFRGADLFAYLSAREHVSQIHTLITNYRSTPSLVAAINAIFACHPCPFVFPDIVFRPAIGVNRGTAITWPDNLQSEPLQLWYLPEDFLRDHDATSKDRCRELIADLTAREISRLLETATRGELLMGDRPLIPDDIVVLVRDRYEGQLVQRTLRRLGITSVFQRAGLLFATEEAKECKWILKAILEPHRGEILRAALTTPIMGVTGSDIPTMELEDYHERCIAYLSRWEDEGFLPMFREFLSREGVRERLLDLPEGERRLTNVLHLGEVLHGIETKEHLTPAGLFKWLSARIDGDVTGNEAYELRLESDQGAITISTIHKSKGLEFPVVFCPFLWWETSAKQGEKGSLAVTVHHVRENDAWRRVVTPLWDKRGVNDAAWMESLAEGCRLVYVALTRAIHRCYVIWGKFPGSGTSPLAYLLHYRAGTVTEKDLSEYWKGMSDGDLFDDVTALAQAAPDQLRVFPITSYPPLPRIFLKPPSPSLAPRTPVSVRERTEGIASFTFFVSHETEEDDEIYLETPSPPPETFARVDPVFLFPQGVRSGSAIHRIMEQLDFTHLEREGTLRIIAACLRTYGLDPAWQEAIWTLVERVITTPLNLVSGPLSLSAISPRDRATEMAFAFPLAHITAARLASLFPDNDFATRLTGLQFPPLQGYLKGAIDLIFRHENRYYIIDWKTNHLGYTYEDYAQDRLQAIMYDHFYPLQYHLYLLALHRHLLRHVPHYTYEEHMGGVFYLFVRGINPEIDDSMGIFEDRPPLHVIDQLDTYLCQEDHGP